MAEAGFPGVGTLHWQSMLAPAATPKPVIDTLFKAIVEASKQPALRRRSTSSLSASRSASRSDEAKTWLKGELDTWRKITSRSEDRSGGVEFHRHGRACPGHPDSRGPRCAGIGMPGTRPGMTRIGGDSNETRSIWLCCLSSAVVCASSAQAQDKYPSKPVKVDGAVRRRQRHRHRHPHRRRAVAPAELGQQTSWSRTSPAPSASSPSRKWRRRGPTATRCRSAIPAPTC